MKLVYLLAVVAVASARPGDHYDGKLDDFDVNEMITNKRLLLGYTHCFLGKGNCTPDGKDIKKLFPEAIQTSCGKCTDKQKVMVAKAIHAIQEQLPEEYAELLKQNDPDNKYRDELKKYLAKYSA